MESKKAQKLASKIVNVLGTHEVATVDDTSKVYEIDEGKTPEDFTFDKTTHHVYRFAELGYMLVGADASQRKAKAEVVDILAHDLETEALVLSDDWEEQNLKAQ